MFEHADRDDPVIDARQSAVVGQAELDPVSEPFRAGAVIGDAELFARQGDAEHLRAVFAGEVEPEAAPAAADVEHAHSRREAELGGDQRLLARLRLFERVAARREIGAGILAVAVEEEGVEFGRQVVVVARVPQRPSGRVDLVEGTQPVPAEFEGAAPPDRPLPGSVGDQKREKAGKVIVDDGKAAVHIGFAKRDLGSENQPARQGRVVQPYADMRGSVVAVAARLTVGEGHVQRPPTEIVPQQSIKNRGPHDPTQIAPAPCRLSAACDQAAGALRRQQPESRGPVNRPHTQIGSGLGGACKPGAAPARP